MRMLIALALAAASIGFQEKTYDLRVESKPYKGRKCDIVKKDFHKVILKVNGQAAARVESARDFVASEEILDVDPGGQTKRRWTFTKATHRNKGQLDRYTFHGKSVVATDAKGANFAFGLEGGGELTKQDVEGLKSFASDEQKGKPGAAEFLLPDKPVKAGETWTRDPKKFIDSMDEKEMAYSMDAAGSKIAFTLNSVEVRGGTEFAKITGFMEFMITACGPFKFDRPIPMKFLGNFDSCFDGKSPEGELTMRGEMVGKVPAKTDRGDVDVDVDFTMVLTKTVKLSK